MTLTYQRCMSRKGNDWGLTDNTGGGHSKYSRPEQCQPFYILALRKGHSHFTLTPIIQLSDSAGAQTLGRECR